MDFSKIPKLNPKRINRCYCYTNCWCDISAYNRPVPNKPNKTTQPTTKFVKIRNENGQLRPKCDRNQYSGLESFNSNSCSSHKGLTKSTSCNSSSNQSRRRPSSSSVSIKTNSSNKDEFIKSYTNKLKWESLADNGLTEPRQWYEQSKEQFWKARECPTRNLLLTNFFTNPAFFLSQLDDRQIAELNDFRLQNSKDCFNVLSKYTINKRLGYYNEKPPPQHVCEFSFKLNERGLLEPSSGESYFGAASKHIRCRICGKEANVTDANGIVPTANHNQKVQKIIVEVNNVGNNGGGNKKAIKSKSGMRRKKMDEPGNSLALIYQKKY